MINMIKKDYEETFDPFFIKINVPVELDFDFPSTFL